MSGFPVTIGGKTFSSSDFSGRGYVASFPSVMKAVEGLNTGAETGANSSFIWNSIIPMEPPGRPFPFISNFPFCPRIGAFVFYVPKGMDIGKMQHLSFSALSGPGHFVMRVDAYMRELGYLWGTITGVTDPSPSQEWRVGTMPEGLVASTSASGGTGLSELYQFNAARQTLSLPDGVATELVEEFHLGMLPYRWYLEGRLLTSGGVGSLPAGAGPHPPRSFLRLRTSATEGGGTVYSPYIVGGRGLSVSIRAKTRWNLVDIGASGTKMFRFRFAGIQVDCSGAENFGRYVIRSESSTTNTSILPAGGTTYETWEIVATHLTRTVIRNGVTVATIPSGVYPGMFHAEYSLFNMDSETPYNEVSINYLVLRSEN